jgi:hypothetical protein
VRRVSVIDESGARRCSSASARELRRPRPQSLCTQLVRRRSDAVAAAHIFFMKKTRQETKQNYFTFRVMSLRPYRRDARADALDEVPGLPLYLFLDEVERARVVHGVVEIVARPRRCHGIGLRQWHSLPGGGVKLLQTRFCYVGLPAVIHQLVSCHRTPA